MYSAIIMRISGENPYGWEDKIDSMKKRGLVLLQKMKTTAKSNWKTLSRVGQEDPCRVIHSLKVGFSLTLVSLLYLLEPFFKGIGQNAIWALMTVVVVLEFTAGQHVNFINLSLSCILQNMKVNYNQDLFSIIGATLCKGLNRGIGTFLAGSLAFFIDYIAQESGRVFRAIFIGSTVFVVGTCMHRLMYNYVNRLCQSLCKSVLPCK